MCGEGKVRDGRRVLYICVNRPESPGLMQKVQPVCVCRNYRPRQIRASRRKRPKSPPDEVRYIALTRDRFAMVDARDYKRLARHRWYASREQLPGQPAGLHAAGEQLQQQAAWAYDREA